MSEIGQKSWKELAPHRALLALDYPLEEAGDWHIHTVQQLAFCTDGEAELHIEDRIEILAGDFAVFIPPGVPHKLARRTADTACCIYIDSGSLPLALEKIPFTSLMVELYRALANRGTSASDSHILTELCLREYIHSSSRQSSQLTVAKDARLLKICNFFKSKPEDSRSLADVASDFGMSERNLHRLAVAEFGYSMHEWRNRSRILRSLELMSEGAGPSRIYLEVGYSSQGTFSRAFSRYTSMTPLQYYRTLPKKSGPSGIDMEG